MTTQEYIDIINIRLKARISQEHSYQSDLKTLIKVLVTSVEIINESAKATDCRNPDYVIMKHPCISGLIPKYTKLHENQLVKKIFICKKQYF